MAMITRDEVKAILQITVATYDTLIDTLLPIAEGMYLDIRGIPFFIFTGNIVNASNIIEFTEEENINLVARQDKVETRDDDGAGMRGRISYLDFTDYEIVLDSNATETEDEQEFIVYPASADYSMAKIIDYMMQKDNATGYKSETFGTYDYTKFDQKTGLPSDIAQTIKKYQPGK